MFEVNARRPVPDRIERVGREDDTERTHKGRRIAAPARNENEFAIGSNDPND